VSSIPAAEILLRDLDEKPEIAIVDVMLPEINGLEGTPRLKLICPSMRVYLVSAYRDQAQIFQAAAIKVGAEAFIPKDELDLETIQDWKTNLT
jgi:DNA-binding NarL/FixJ family response regulator